MRIDIPEGANKVIEGLEAAGYEAYIVGGCVRDSNRAWNRNSHDGQGRL